MPALEDEDTVGNRQDVRDALGDEQNRESSVLQVPDQTEQFVGLGDTQSGRGFIHNQDLRLEGDGAGAGNHLALTAGHSSYIHLGGLDVDAQLLDQLFSPFVHAGLIQQQLEGPASAFPADEDVPGNVQVVKQGQILVDHSDTLV